MNTNEQLALFQKGYATTDYEFACTLSAMNIGIQVDGFIPDPESSGGNKGRRYWILLVGKDANGSAYDPTEQIAELQRKYINGELLVEPLLLFRKMRAIRAAMLRTGSAAAPKGKQGGKGSSGKLPRSVIRKGGAI